MRLGWSARNATSHLAQATGLAQGRRRLRISGISGDRATTDRGVPVRGARAECSGLSTCSQLSAHREWGGRLGQVGSDLHEFPPRCGDAIGAPASGSLPPYMAPTAARHPPHSLTTGTLPFLGPPDLMDPRPGGWDWGRCRGAGSSSSAVFAGQMERSARLVRDFPQATLVLLHAVYGDTIRDGWASWRAGMRGLAAAPSGRELSGSGPSLSPARSSAGAVIEDTVDIFGRVGACR